MPYWPAHRPQLTGIPTESTDCGTRATQMMLDDLSVGRVIRSIKRIREIMGDKDETNYEQWDEVIDQLGGSTIGFAGEKTNSWDRYAAHVKGGGSGIIAIDYGHKRKIMPAKCGSKTFDGYHAEFTKGNKKPAGGTRLTRDFDSLLDGRYRGCPNGPVWVPLWKLRDTALEVGKKVLGQPDKVFAVLGHPDPDIEPIEPGDLIPGSGLTLGDVLANLYETLSIATEPAVIESLERDIEDLEDLIGVVRNPEADEYTEVKSGIVFLPQAA